MILLISDDLSWVPVTLNEFQWSIMSSSDSFEFKWSIMSSSDSGWVQMIHDDFEWFCWVHMIYFEFWVIQIAVSPLIWTHFESWKSHELILSHENHLKSWTHKRLFPPCFYGIVLKDENKKVKEKRSNKLVHWPVLIVYTIYEELDRLSVLELNTEDGKKIGW